MHRWIIEGADRDTGKDKQVIVEADSREDATRQASKMGLLVSGVSPASERRSRSFLIAIVIGFSATVGIVGGFFYARRLQPITAAPPTVVLPTGNLRAAVPAKASEQAGINQLQAENERLKGEQLQSQAAQQQQLDQVDAVRTFDRFTKTFFAELQRLSDLYDEKTPGISMRYSDLFTDVRRTDSLKSPLIGVAKFNLFEDCNQQQFGNQWSLGYSCIVEFNITPGNKYQILSATSDVTTRIPPDAGTASGTNGHQDMLAGTIWEPLLEKSAQLANAGVAER